VSHTFQHRIVRQCDWHDAPFGKLEALPLNGKPVTLWDNRDEAWTQVAKLFKVTVRTVLERSLEALERNSPKDVSLPSKPQTKAPEVSRSVLAWIRRKFVVFHQQPREAPGKNIRL
jgi:hypothetical protein